MTIVMENVKTLDDRFYVGMTKLQAEDEGRKTTKLFSKLDTDGDGFLSFDEVMAKREQRENKIKIGRNIWGGICFSQCIGGIGLEYQAVSNRSRIGQLIITMILAGITLGKHLKMKKWQKQDVEYRTQYQELIKRTGKEIEQIQAIQKAEEYQHEIKTAA